MKKVLFVLLAVLLVSGLALAQFTGNTNYIPLYDNNGAHENGGRGCAGCHAPHSGGRGSGGNTISKANGGTQEDGNGGLWGTDVTAIYTSFKGQTIQFGNGAHVGKLTVDYMGAGTDGNWSSDIYKGVLTCLSCHDGVVSKGAMMSGFAYEQMFGILNNATYLNAARNTGLVTAMYGPNPIPTLLGSDSGLSSAGYLNDHPLGQTANLYAALGSIYYGGNAAIYGLNPVIASGAHGGSALSVAGSTGMYGQFLAEYAAPAISGMVANQSNPTLVDGWFVVCTTCHNQHSMSVWKGTVGVGGGALAGQFRTIFYVNGPYNPAGPYDPTHVPSTERFCEQCHFSHSNEYYGATTIGTAF